MGRHLTEIVVQKALTILNILERGGNIFSREDGGGK